MVVHGAYQKVQLVKLLFLYKAFVRNVAAENLCIREPLACLFAKPVIIVYDNKILGYGFFAKTKKAGNGRCLSSFY